MQNIPQIFQFLNSNQSEYQKLLRIKATIQQLENGNLLFLLELFEHYKKCLMLLNSSVNKAQEVYKVAIVNSIQRLQIIEAFIDKNKGKTDRSGGESSIRESMMKELDYLCKQLDSNEN